MSGLVRFNGLDTLNQNWLWSMDLTIGKSYKTMQNTLGTYIFDEVNCQTYINYPERAKYFTKL